MAELTALTSLKLNECPLVSDHGLQAVTALKTLTILSLHDCFLVTNDGVRAVAQLTDLTSFNLSGCSLVSDDGLRAVAEVKSLTKLDLTGCWQGQPPEVFVGCGALTTLSLQHNPRDGGAAETDGRIRRIQRPAPGQGGQAVGDAHYAQPRRLARRASRCGPAALVTRQSGAGPY